jgi:hypothetical protein
MAVPETQARGGGSTADLGGLAPRRVLTYPPTKPKKLGFYEDRGGSWEAVEVDGIPLWLPVLTPFILTEGVNGVGTRALNEPEQNRMRRHREIIEAERVIILDHQVEVPTELLPAYASPGGYLRDWDLGGNKRHYHCVWDEPRPPTADGTFLPLHHRELYNRWRCWLVTSGQIPTPSMQVLEVARATVRAYAAGVNTKAGDEPDAARRDQRTGRQGRRLDITERAVVPGSPEHLAAIEARVVAAKPAARKPAAVDVGAELEAMRKMQAELEAELARWRAEAEAANAARAKAEADAAKTKSQADKAKADAKTKPADAAAPPEGDKPPEGA